MVLEIRGDACMQTFEVCTKDARFESFPYASPNRWGTGYYTSISGDWYRKLVGIATWVNNELKEECLFEIS